MKDRLLKEKVPISLRLLTDGEVIREVVGESSSIIETRHFGKLSEAELERVFEVFKQESPEIEIQSVELTGN